jgi:hypothetical protein
MKTYSIINPSDPYTFLAPDRQIAAIVIFLLSPSYGAKCLSHPGSNEDVPLFPFGGSRQWWAHAFPGSDMEKIINTRAHEISEALSSILYGTEEARQSFNDLYGRIKHPKVLRQLRIAWNNARRKSLTDIPRSAYATADAISLKKAK